MTTEEKLIHSVNHMLWDTDLIGSRVTLAFGSFFWALLLLWPGTTYQLPLYSSYFFPMPGSVWGILFLITGAVQAGILIVDALHSRLARYADSWNAILWLYVVVSVAISTYPPPAIIGGEIALAASALWIWARPHILIEGYKRVAKRRSAFTPFE